MKWALSLPCPKPSQCLSSLHSQPCCPAGLLSCPATWPFYSIKSSKLLTCSASCPWMFISLRACMLHCVSRVSLFETLWTIAHQTLLSMGFSRQEYWSGLPCPTQGIFLIQGLNPSLRHLLHSRQILYCWATGEALPQHTQLTYKWLFYQHLSQQRRQEILVWS